MGDGAGTGPVRFRHAQQLLRLVCEGHEIGRGSPEAWRHILDGMCTLLGARYGSMARMTGFLPGGHQGVGLKVLSAGYAGEKGAARVVEALSTRATANPAALVLMSGASSGVAVTASRRELVVDRAWYRSGFVNDYVRPACQDDCLLGATLEGQGRSTGLAFLREWGQRPFGPDDRNLLHLFMTECVPVFARRPSPPPARETVLALSARAPVRLAPRATAVLTMLLAGCPDKEIAERLSISFHTERDYVKAIFRAYGVSSRAQLLSLHLR